MIIEHSLLNKCYSIDCCNNEIETYFELKSHLITLIDGIHLENIKFILNGKEIGDNEQITNDIEKIYMAIIPIKCCEHISNF